MAREDDKGFGVATSVFTLLTVLLAFVALAVAGQALARSNEAKQAAQRAGGGTQVTLSEFRINPGVIEAPVGGALSVRNAGSVVHNLTIKGTSLKTPDIKGSGVEYLDVSSLKAGSYEVFCSIPGHRDAGMVAELSIGGGHAAGHLSGASTVSAASAAANDAADQRMLDVIKRFPAKTAGVGALPLAPKVLPDGTKEFDLTAKVVDWEVEPGKLVKAWAYNGTVPGPTIKVAVGDKVRVVLTNELPESTAIHFHGLLVPNSMDGVPGITQDPVKPGETFTYDFVAQGPAVGMYHSHHHAETQVPDGLAGAFLIGDEPVPPGVSVNQEVPLMLNDAGVVGFALNGKSFPATAPIVAKLGDWVEIQYLNEGLQSHPMHLHGMAQLVIAKDGYAVPQPYQADTVLVAPGERYTVLVHATEPGVWAFHCHILTHAENENGMFGMVTAFIVQ